MEAVEVEQPRAGIDNGKSSSERIIPITVLDCKHNNDENDNTSTSTTTGMSNVSKCPEKMSRIFAKKNVPQQVSQKCPNNDQKERPTYLNVFTYVILQKC